MKKILAISMIVSSLVAINVTSIVQTNGGAVIAAEVKPVVKTTKKPFNPAIGYCNGMEGVRGGLNVACYNHDACYSDPTFKGSRKPPATRKQCDDQFGRDCRQTALALRCFIMSAGISLGGKARWDAAREHDKTEK